MSEVRNFRRDHIWQDTLQKDTGSSGRSRISLRWGYQLPGGGVERQYMILPDFPKNCMNPYDPPMRSQQKRNSLLIITRFCFMIKRVYRLSITLFTSVPYAHLDSSSDERLDDKIPVKCTRFFNFMNFQQSFFTLRALYST